MLEQAGISFWEVHSIVFVICMLMFPRITMLFSSICFAPWFGVMAWLGWVFVPRITVAIFASLFYLNTNPYLCFFTWIWALGHELIEYKVCQKIWGNNS